MIILVVMGEAKTKTAGQNIYLATTLETLNRKSGKVQRVPRPPQVVYGYLVKYIYPYPRDIHDNSKVYNASFRIFLSQLEAFHVIIQRTGLLAEVFPSSYEKFTNIFFPFFCSKSSYHNLN